MIKKLLLVFLIIILVTYYFFHALKKESSSISKSEVWVEVSETKEDVIPLTIKALGALVAPTVTITPEIAGHVKIIGFADGEEVAAKTLLLQLDDQLEQTKLKSAKAQLSFASANYERAMILSKRNIISKKELQESLAILNEKEALVDEAQVLINKMNLLAPFAGRVSQRKVNLGEYVTAGQEVVTLANYNQIRIEYSLPERYKPFLKIGQEILITTPTFPSEKFIAHLAYISPTIDVNTRNIFLYATFPIMNNKLMPGMFVSVQQFLENTKGLFIPDRSLLTNLDGNMVYKIINHKAIETPVKVGRKIGSQIQIVSGLKSGDLIMTDGQFKVKDGMDVRFAQDGKNVSEKLS